MGMAWEATSFKYASLELGRQRGRGLRGSSEEEGPTEPDPTGDRGRGSGVDTELRRRADTNLQPLSPGRPPHWVALF